MTQLITKRGVFGMPVLDKPVNQQEQLKRIASETALMNAYKEFRAARRGHVKAYGEQATGEFLKRCRQQEGE